MNEHHTPFDTEAVFGELPVDDAALESVRRAIGRLRDECATRPAPEPRGALSLMLVEPHDLHDVVEGPWMLREAAQEAIPGGHERRGPRLRHRLAVAVAAVVGTAGLATGLAAAQMLPAPLQRAAHDVLSFTGVDVPTAPGDSGSSPTTSPTVDGGRAPATAPGGVVSSTVEGGAPSPPAPASGAVPPLPGAVPPVASVPPAATVPPTLLPNLPLTVPPLPQVPLSTPVTLPSPLPTLPELPPLIQ